MILPKGEFIIPPEFTCFMVPSKPGPKIIGWTFQTNLSGVYFARNSNNLDYVTLKRAEAQVYSDKDIMLVSRNNWNWGHKSKGKWRAVYAKPTNA